MTTLSRPIRSASLHGYIDLVRSLGADPHPFLRRAGLSTRLLENPENLIPSEAVRKLLEDTAQATGTEDFALQLAARRTFSNLGPISLVLKEEPTPRQALDTLCRYLKLLNASLITRIEETGNTVIIREELLVARVQTMRQSMELAVGVMFRILRELIGPQWRPLQVCFSHRPPARAGSHQSFFGQRVSFNHEFNGLVCAAPDLQIAQPSSNPAVARFAREYLETALSHQRDGARALVSQLVLALLPGGRCTAKQVAHHLGVDRRTLHRHLSAEALTFSSLLDQIRSDLVMRHLRDSDLPLSEISSLLGFSAPSAFSHWFRATFGCSVTQWRKQNGAASPSGD